MGWRKTDSNVCFWLSLEDLLLEFAIWLIPQNLVTPTPLLNGSIEFLGVLRLEVCRVQDDIFTFVKLCLNIDQRLIQRKSTLARWIIRVEAFNIPLLTYWINKFSFSIRITHNRARNAVLIFKVHDNLSFKFSLISNCITMGWITC